MSNKSIKIFNNLEEYCYNKDVISMKKINLSLVFLVSFLFMEIVYKLLLGINIFKLSFLNMFIFLISLSFILGVLCTLSSNKKVNKIVFIVLLSLITIWFSAQYVVKSYFDFYISLSTFGVADQVTDFMGKAVIETLRRIPGIILFFVPLVVSLIFSKRICFKQNNIKQVLVLLAIGVGFYGVYIASLFIGKDATYSPYVLNYKVNDISLSMENLGVLNTFVLDTKRAIFGFEEKLVHVDNPLSNDKDKDQDTPKVYDYNNLDIDFDSLIANESNSAIKSMHEYFKNDPGTLQNDYTGFFKDKNLILFMAESFNEVAVKKEITPTLYKLSHSGFVFEDFYTPTIFSTIGGEFQELTGLYASGTDILGRFRTGNVAFPQGVATKFKEAGYNTYAYHNNSASFQSRNKYLPSLGFDNFKACNTGLEKVINCNLWPRSDLEMIDATVDEYATEGNKFMVFYASNSGHSSYDGFNSNQMAKKNKEEYLASGLNYSERAATYLAAQMELDKALDSLIKKLDEKGILDNTVIALVGDHYPYDLNPSEVYEMADYQKDDVVEINHSKFILWNNKMDTVNVSKVGSQLDVIPTIYNAFGINYDSRLFIGKDILSTEGGLAMFANKSWVSDKGTYFSSSGKFVPKDGVEVDDTYVKTMNQIVLNKINMSTKIIMNNYYSKVFK